LTKAGLIRSSIYPDIEAYPTSDLVAEYELVAEHELIGLLADNAICMEKFY
jgi:hypothetical protein